MFVYTWSDHHCRSSACGPASLCCRLYKESNMDIWDLSRLPACLNLNSQTERQLLTQDGKLSQQAGLAQLGGSVDQGTHFYNEEKIKPVTSFSYSMLTTKTFCRWRGRRCSVSWGILPSVRPISTPSPSCWRWANTPRGRRPLSRPCWTGVSTPACTSPPRCRQTTSSPWWEGRLMTSSPATL